MVIESVELNAKVINELLLPKGAAIVDFRIDHIRGTNAELWYLSNKTELEMRSFIIISDGESFTEKSIYHRSWNRYHLIEIY